jgi:hypothetical protein
MHASSSVSGRRIAALLTLVATLAATAPTPAPVTDATVVARLGDIQRKQDHEALAAYYRAKAAAALPDIEFQEQLLRAYMPLNRKHYEALQGEARALLKAARMTKKHYELLATAHQRMAYEWED